MDATEYGIRPGMPWSRNSEESSSSRRSSEDYNVDGTAGHTIIGLSPESKKSNPRVYSANPARRMMDDRAVRIDEEIQRRQDDNSANHLSSDSLNKLKAYAEIQKEIRKALDGEQSDLKQYPDELAAVKEASEYLEELINEDIDYYKTGPSRELLTLSAGAVSYLLTFCTGTLLASGLEMPWLSPIVIGICWTLCERFPPMIRATSWSNKHADLTYPEIMRMTKRAARDWPRQLIGLNPKYFIRNGKKMTASEVRDTCSLFQAWLGKVLSDDIVSHTFTLFYIARNVSLRILASPSFLATLPGKVVSLGSLALAGLFAGGTAALGFQGIRGCSYRAENPGNEARGEILVKSTKIWGAEDDLVAANIALIRRYAMDCKENDRTEIDDAIRLMEADRDKASAKSAFLSSLLYEFLCLFQGKSHLGDDDNGEVAGKLHQTISGFFAKMLCLLPSALFITFVVTVFGNPAYSLAQQLSLLTIAPLILILGFGIRKELELAVLAIIGFLEGIVDVASYKITHKDKYQDQKRPVPCRERSPIFSRKTDGGDVQTPESPTSQKLIAKNRPDGARQNTAPSNSSSEDTRGSDCSS